MTRITLLLLLLLPIAQTYAQDYMTEIVSKTCQCAEGVPVDDDVETLTMKLGVCMIEASMPYKERIRKDYDIDLDNLTEAEGEKLGRLVGVKLAGACPGIITRLSQSTNSNKPARMEGTGTVTKIETETFVTFSIKDDTGKTLKYYWMSFVESAGDLTAQYKSLQGKKVRFTYIQQEFFDPRLNEYRQFAVLSTINPE